jgi:hypothetical protein
MDDYKTKLINEYHELKDKYDKLCAFILRVEEGSSPIHDDYPVRELYEQQVAMEAYLDALSARLAYEGVET